MKRQTLANNRSEARMRRKAHRLDEVNTLEIDARGNPIYSGSYNRWLKDLEKELDKKYPHSLIEEE